MNTNDSLSETPLDPSSEPTLEPSSDTSAARDRKSVVIMVLAISFIATWGYLIWSKNSDNRHMKDVVKQYETANAKNLELQNGFDASLARLDSLTGYNYKIEGELVQTNSEISRLRTKIEYILRQQRITDQTRRKAQELIAELNAKIHSLEQELARLKMENEALVVENTAVTSERNIYKAQKDTLELVTRELNERIVIASTLNAFDITVTPVDKTGNNKERATTKTKKADKFVIAFDVENRIVETGSTVLYLLVVGPDGKPFTLESADSCKFVSRDEGEKQYTLSMPVDVEAGKKKHVEFAWNKSKNFQQGDYHFAIYHNGFKIGERLMKVKKGRLVS